MNCFIFDLNLHKKETEGKHLPSSNNSNILFLSSQTSTLQLQSQIEFGIFRLNFDQKRLKRQKQRKHSLKNKNKTTVRISNNIKILIKL